MKELLETNDVDKSSRTNFNVDLFAYNSFLFHVIYHAVPCIYFVCAHLQHQSLFHDILSAQQNKL